MSKPTPAQVLYADPNPDGTRKKCENCFAWAKDKNRCLYFKDDVSVKRDDVCAMHVYGRNRTEWVDRGIEALDPKSIGFEKKVGEGTSCDTCVNYNDGTCMVVEVNGQPAKVKKLACCSMWTKKAEEVKVAMKDITEDVNISMNDIS